MKSLYKQMGGTYHLGADGMYYPNLELPEEETPRYGKYGKMRHAYLREHKKAYDTTLLFDGKLVAHLNEIDDATYQTGGKRPRGHRNAESTKPNGMGGSYEQYPQCSRRNNPV